MENLMPTIFEWNGYRFFFFSNEGTPLEPAHVHVRNGSNIAKFWLIPEVKVAKSWGLTSRELNTLELIVEENKNLIMEKWNEFFN